MSAPAGLRIRTAELEWASKASLGLLPGQLTRDELLDLLSESDLVQEEHGDVATARRALSTKGRVELEQLYNTCANQHPFPAVAAGRMRGLEWVDATVTVRDKPFYVLTSKEDKLQRFRHIPYGYFLPSVLTNAAISAQTRGEPTVLEGYMLVFGWVEWLIASRDLIWSPHSPKPELLAILSEAFGIGPELHREDPERLKRLAARLPTWYPHRGPIERAFQLLEETLGEELTVRGVQLHSSDAERAAVPLREEVFSCRSAEWWRHRQRGDAAHVSRSEPAQPTVMRIEDGLLRYQSEEEDNFGLAQEDVLIAWHPGEDFPTSLSRVLPLWVSLRVVALHG